MESRKLGNRSKRCHFIEYPKEAYRYQFYHVKDQKVITSKHAHLLKEDFMMNEGAGNKVDIEKEARKTQGETTKPAHYVEENVSQLVDIEWTHPHHVPSYISKSKKNPINDTNF